MIEIHLDGKPVTKLEAARAVSIVGARGVRIGFPGEDGTLEDSVDLYGRRHAYGEIEPPLGSSSSFGADAGRMRRRAQVLLLGAEIAELAMMLAAEQDAQEAAPADAEAWQPGWAMNEDDPLYLRECEWVRRNGGTATGIVIGREGKCLIINALDVRATPFKVPGQRVKITRKAS